MMQRISQELALELGRPVAPELKALGYRTTRISHASFLQMVSVCDAAASPGAGSARFDFSAELRNHEAPSVPSDSSLFLAGITAGETGWKLLPRHGPCDNYAIPKSINPRAIWVFDGRP